MHWITTKHGVHVCIDDYSYYKYKERKINKRDYAKLCSEINTNKDKFSKGKNKIILYSDTHQKWYKYNIYFEDFDKFAIISRRIEK